MVRVGIGVGLAAVVMFVYGFAYWGLNTAPYDAWQRAPDDAEAQEALREIFPRSGTYFVPGVGHDAETRGRLSEQGPVVYAHVDHDGRPMLETANLLRGFGVNLGAALLLAIVLAMAARPSYAGRLALAAVAGLGAVVLIDLGDAVWWYVPIEWKAWQAFYDWSVWTLGGAVLAAFTAPS